MPEKVAFNPSLGFTAHWTASARAQESARTDCLFNDPWALKLAGEVGMDWLAQRSGSVAPMIIRTHYFDGFLKNIAWQQAVRQIVILAAGLDTRAYRLDWPEQTHLFEIDQPNVLEYKADILTTAGAKPKCVRTEIATDLTQPWREPLLQHGFDPGQPSGWLLEGLLFYLPVESITQILDQVSHLAVPGSWLGFDIINSLTLTSPYTKAWIDMQASYGAPWIGSMDDPEGFLAERGWQANLSQPGAPDANYGRWALPIYPAKAPNLPHNWYVTAHKPGSQA